MNLNVDLANNKPLAKTTIKLISIENSTQEGDKPALTNLKQQLQEVYGIISMSKYALDKS